MRWQETKSRSAPRSPDSGDGRMIGSGNVDIAHDGKVPTPSKTRRSPRGAFGSAGAQAPCWVGPGAAWPPIGCRSTAALLTYL